MRTLRTIRVHPTQTLRIPSKKHSTQLTPSSIRTLYDVIKTQKDRQKDRQKDAQDLIDAGVNALVKRRIDEAESYFMRAARFGDPSGLLTIGIEYEQGALETRDLYRARYMYMKCMSYYHMNCSSKAELEYNTVSVVSQIEQVTRKIKTQEEHSLSELCIG